MIQLVVSFSTPTACFFSCLLMAMTSMIRKGISRSIYFASRHFLQHRRTTFTQYLMMYSGYLPYIFITTILFDDICCIYGSRGSFIVMIDCLSMFISCAEFFDLYSELDDCSTFFGFRMVRINP